MDLQVLTEDSPENVTAVHLIGRWVIIAVGPPENRQLLARAWNGRVYELDALGVAP